jgi:putative membrane-bound dehydrogenase-like protein
MPAVACRLFVVCLFLGGMSSSARAAEVEAGKYRFRVPDGFTVELVAAPPLVRYPVCADFDDQGRMYVCESSGSIDWNKPQPADNLHRVLRLEDSDGDGVFDRRTVFAEFEMMAQGSMWLNGSLYVAAAPVIWKLTDSDDDGVAEQRQEWVKTDAVTGCLNDLRGPYRGLDGFVYWCKGPALQEYTVDGKPWSSSARHILRRHPDGKDVDSLMVGGMDNPVEVSFTLGGQRMVTCTNLQMLGAPRDDGILHAIYGGVYPKDIAPVFEFPWTGPEMMPLMTVWGAMSPAGLMTCQSEVLGKDYRGNLFSALFSGHKILRHALTPEGSTFGCTNEDFLVCDRVEFHPTDIYEDADGSLLMIETGGWYRNCCPSSTFYRPDVDGAIYRIRKLDAPKVEDARGLKIAWSALGVDELAKLLDDPRFVVRDKAIAELGRRGGAATSALRGVVHSTEASALSRLGAIWAVTQAQDEAGIDILIHALDAEQSDVRQAAMSGLSLHRSAAAIGGLRRRLKSPDPHDQRLAAEALGRLKDAQVVPDLLGVLQQSPDRCLEHAIIYALIEIADVGSLTAALSAEPPAIRRAALIALDQMPAGKVQPSQLLGALSAPDVRLQEAAWWIVSRHPEVLGGLLTDHLRKVLAAKDTSQEERNRLQVRLSRLIRTPELSRWVVGELTASGVPAATRMLILQSMRDAGGQNVDPQWIEALLKLMQASGRDEQLVSQVVATVAKLPPMRTSDPSLKELSKTLQQAMVDTARVTTIDPATRLKALGAAQSAASKLDEELFGFLLVQLAPEQGLELRTSAAEALAKAKLTPNQLQRLAKGLKNLAASELNTLLPLFEGSSDEALGRSLVQSLLGSSSAGSLNAFRVKGLLAGYPPAIQAEARTLLERLEAAQAELLAKADEVTGLIPQADPHRGRQVFSSQKAACAACHKTANVGGITGPHLRGIGARRTDRDLIESILFPNASLVQSYDTWQALTEDGQVMTGVLVEDRPDEIVLSAGVDKVYRIPRASIEQLTRSDQSMMPTGLDKLISNQEFADLIAYLKTL